MSLLKNIGLLACLTAFSSPAFAGLYGFSEGVPYSQEEEILDEKSLPKKIINYRAEMRDNINSLAEYAKENRKDFMIVVHEGEELLIKSLWEFHLEGYENARKKGIDADDPSFLVNLKETSPGDEPLVGTPQSYYINNIDGIALNNLFCSDRKPHKRTKESGLRIISIDKCKNAEAYDEAIVASSLEGSLIYAFINPASAFNKIKGQPVLAENTRAILAMEDAENIQIFIDDSLYADKGRMIDDIMRSNYDIIVIEPLFHGKEPFTPEEINDMRLKKSGPKRILLALQNVSEAKDTDYYWKKGWVIGSPSMLKRPSFTNKNAVIVEYWQDGWKKIMSKYFKAIVDSGFDGAFLTGVENHRYFEKQTPLE